MVKLCALTQIADPGAIELSWGDCDWPLSLFIVRRGPAVFGFLNRCPHAGHELNLKSDEFLTRDGELIMCRSHGARFRIEDGLCVLGPCPGAYLQGFAVAVEEEAVVAERAELERLAAAAGR